MILNNKHWPVMNPMNYNTTCQERCAYWYNSGSTITELILCLDLKPTPHKREFISSTINLVKIQ